MAKEKEIEELMPASEEESTGTVKIANEVVVTIAALAATEIRGVACLQGGITHDQIARHGSKNLSKAVSITVEDKKVAVTLSIVIEFGSSLPVVSSQVQERVRSAIENMTGLTVTDVKLTVSGMNMK